LQIIFLDLRIPWASHLGVFLKSKPLDPIPLDLPSREGRRMKNWGSGEWSSPDPQFFNNLLIIGVGQAWIWDNFKKAPHTP
jgi:hypothetical protein